MSDGRQSTGPVTCQRADAERLTDRLMNMELRARGKEKREGRNLEKYGLKRRGESKEKGVCDLHLSASTTDGDRVYWYEILD